MPEWIKSLSPVEAAFIGSLLGSSVTLLVGIGVAFLNAHLNRRRDDRLRQNEVRAIIAGLRAELLAIADTLTDHAAQLENRNTIGENFYVPDPARMIKLLPTVLEKMGLLNEATISVVMKAFVAVEEYVNRLVLGGGATLKDVASGRTIIEMPGHQADGIRKLNRAIVVNIQEAVAQLDASRSSVKFL